MVKINELVSKTNHVWYFLQDYPIAAVMTFAVCALLNLIVELGQPVY